MHEILCVSRTQSRECSERLEPDIRKRIRPVLRGGVDGNAAPLPDTLRLTGIGQMIKGLVEVPESSALSGFLPTDDEFTNERVSIAALEKKRESMKWNVWNGNVTRALERTEELVDDLETWPPTADKVVKLKKAVNEFASYIAVNQASIPN